MRRRIHTFLKRLPVTLQDKGLGFRVCRVFCLVATADALLGLFLMKPSAIRL